MDLEQQLRAALAPCSPAPALRATVMARVSAAEWRSTQDARRKPGRTLLFATVLAVAAAAAMLMYFSDKPAPLAIADAPTVAHALQPATVVPDSAVALDVKPEPATQTPAAMPVDAGVQPFTVQLNLQDRTTDDESRATIRALHAAVLARLRVVPGLTLVESVAGGAEETTATHLITLSGSTRNPDNKITTAIEVRTFKPDGTVASMFGVVSSTSVAPRCVDPAAADLTALVAEPWRCADPASMASHFVGSLRRKAFPPDPALKAQLRAQLLDQRLHAKQRLSALGDMISLGQSTPVRPIAGGTSSSVQIDSASVRGAIDIAATATDPTVRAQVWRTIRKMHSPELLQPLLLAAREEIDGEARLEAVSTLATDFASDGQARAALEHAASEDSRPLVRAIARRGLTGEEEWKQYILSSLKDQSRSDTGRIEALVYYMFDRHLPEAVSSKPQLAVKLLDDEATRALAQVLPGLRPSAGLTPPMLGQLMADITSLVKHPAITDILLKGLAGDANALDRAMAARALLGRDEPRVRAALREHGGDQRIRAVLEQASARDPDPARRLMAEEILKPQSPEVLPTQ